MNKLDRQKYEWIWHLYNTNQTDEDFPFENHIPCPPDVWTLPKHVIEYCQQTFSLKQDQLKNKTILDIGCGVAWYLPMLDTLGVKKYIGIDPVAKDLKYSKILSKIVNMDCEFHESTAENYEKCEADTILMLICVQRFSETFKVFEKLKANDIILDSWELTIPTKIPLNDMIAFFKNKGMEIRSKWLYDYPNKSEPDQNRWVVHFSRQAQ